MFASQDLAIRPTAEGWDEPTNEPNPILVEIRRVYRANGWKLRPALELRLLDTTYPNARPDQIAHAREVLTRCMTARLPHRKLRRR
jgi:hypothetical protein